MKKWKNNFIRNSVLLLSLFFSILSTAQCPIVPHPTVYKETPGTLMLGNLLSVKENEFPETCKKMLIERLTDQFSLQVSFSNGKYLLEFKRLQNVPKDFYSILVNDKITVNYSSEESCFYAINSLLHLIQFSDGNAYIQNCFIQDQPRFQWRGLHLDVSRHFFSVDEVKRYIDLMSYYKFNTFHWHLTDDQGWRIEIKKYPRLTEIGAYRDSTVNDHYSTSPRTYTVEKYGGYYSQDEIREVVKYAQDRYITIVPEIEMPGHSRAALAAYPELSCTGEQLPVPGLWGVFDDIFCAHEDNIVFLQNILTEVLELFPSQYIHIGGDEAPKNRWKKCEKCQAVIRENGLKDEHELQSYFIGKMDEFLTKNGRKLIGWDEILEGGLSPNATVMSWRGIEGGIEAAKQHHEVVMSPGSHCYFDHYQGKGSDEPLAIGGYTSLEKVYQFEPIPEALSPQEQHYILGAQANVWTEYIPSFSQVEYMVYPRALALSQVLWTMDKPSYDFFFADFLRFQVPFLNRLDVNYSRTFAKPTLIQSKSERGIKLMLERNQFGLQNNLTWTKDGAAYKSNQSFAEKDSLLIDRTSDEKIIRNEFSISNAQLTSPTKTTIIQHPSLGIDVTYVTQPAEQYNAAKELALIDGVVGSMPWKGNEWVGFREKQITFKVDLGQKKIISAIELGFLEDHGSWIHYPDSIEILVSKKGKKWKSVKVVNWKDGELVKGLFLTKKISLSSKARYVKIDIKPKKIIEIGLPGEGNLPWTFLDELIIF